MKHDVANKKSCPQEQRYRVTEKFSSDSSTASSLSLVVGLRQGNSDSWRRMVDLYGPLVNSWCSIAGVAPDRIPDVMQDVFLAVHRAAENFEPKSETTGFRGWLWMITRNKIHDHYRKTAGSATARGGSTALRQLHEFAVPELPEDDPSEIDETTKLLHRAMAMVKVEFKENTWQVFWRAAVLGHPSDRIAEEMNITQAAVRQNKSRVLRRLRQTLGDLE